MTKQLVQSYVTGDLASQNYLEFDSHRYCNDDNIIPSGDALPRQTDSIPQSDDALPRQDNILSAGDAMPHQADESKLCLSSRDALARQTDAIYPSGNTLSCQDDATSSLLADNTDESCHADATQSQLSDDTDESRREDANSYHLSASLHFLQTTRNKGAKSTDEVHAISLEIQDSTRPDLEFRLIIPTYLRTDCSKLLRFCNMPKSAYVCEGEVVNGSIVSFLRDIWLLNQQSAECSKLLQFSNMPKLAYVCEGDVVENGYLSLVQHIFTCHDTLCINAATYYFNSLEWSATELVYFMILQYIKSDNSESPGSTKGTFASEGDSSLLFKQRRNNFLCNKATCNVKTIRHVCRMITRTIASQSQLAPSTRCAQMQKL
jgi:hypothetical protein